MESLKITTDFITLQQLLKIEGIIGTGGEVKYFLASNQVFVNDILENRRGKKLYPGDVIKVLGKEFKIE